MGEKESGQVTHTDRNGREFRVTLNKGRRWMHVRVEAIQDNAPRCQVRRLKLDMTGPGWAGEMAGFIVGFMGHADDL